MTGSEAARSVLVTRPEPGASATAEALRRAGYEPLVLPLTAIRPLPHPSIPDPSAFDAVAVTSANALRHAPPALIERLRPLPLFAVGAATADAARLAGFADVVTGPGYAADLAALIAEGVIPGARIAYLCGALRKPDLESALSAAGLPVMPVETYATGRLEPTPADIARLGAAPLSAALVYSQEGAHALARLHRRDLVAASLRDAVHICISAAAARPLAGLAMTVVASAPTEPAMFAALAVA